MTRLAQDELRKCRFRPRGRRDPRDYEKQNVEQARATAKPHKKTLPSFAWNVKNATSVANQMVKQLGRNKSFSLVTAQGTMDLEVYW